MIQILHLTDLGHGVEVGADKKLKVKIKDGSALTLDETGLGVTLPEIPEVPTAVKLVEITTDNKLKLTDTKGAVTETALPNQIIDVKATNIALNEQNELVVTLSDNTIIKQSLAKFIDVAKTAQEYHDEIKVLPAYATDVADKLAASDDATNKIIDAIAARVLEKFKAEEVKDFAGNSKGYLVKSTLTAAVAA